MRLITEEEEQQQGMPGLRALANFVDHHGGEDLVRYLHAQDVEIVAHTTGALMKCLRTDSTDLTHPESCWKFFAGKFEIEPSDLSDSDLKDVAQAPGFTGRDYYNPIKHILDLTRDGKINDIDPGTLIVVQATSSENPKVRMHRGPASGHMVVVGVKYDVPESMAKGMLASGRPGEIEHSAIQGANRWEGHSQVQKMASVLDTDSIPLFFRGRLTTTERAISGIEKSSSEDPVFKSIVDDFLSQAGENPTEKDYEKFFRHAIRRFDDMEVRRMDREGKIEDIATVTRGTYQDLVKKLYSRYETVENEIKDTIRDHGSNSQEHQDDYRDLNYLNTWIRDQVGEKVFDQSGPDPVTQAVEALHSSKKEADHATVMQWVRRHLEENGLPQDLYRSHLADANVPQGRQMGKNSLWNAFMSEVEKIIGPRLDEVADSAR